jgi:hypothetical protein
VTNAVASSGTPLPGAVRRGRQFQVPAQRRPAAPMAASVMVCHVVEHRATEQRVGADPRDGLVRADQVTGIDAHQTPALTGKPSRWLLDVVLPVSIGSGHREGWGVTVLHRTLIQTSADPGNAAAALARLLAQLDLISAAGIITTSRGDQQPTGRPATAPDEEELVAEASQVRFRFVPFPHPAPGHHTGPEYL